MPLLSALLGSSITPDDLPIAAVERGLKCNDPGASRKLAGDGCLSYSQALLLLKGLPLVQQLYLRAPKVQHPCCCCRHIKDDSSNHNPAPLDVLRLGTKSVQVWSFPDDTLQTCPQLRQKVSRLLVIRVLFYQTLPSDFARNPQLKKNGWIMITCLATPPTSHT